MLPGNAFKTLLTSFILGLVALLLSVSAKATSNRSHRKLLTYINDEGK